MAGNRVKGDIGEREIVKKISCPNCGRKFMLMPSSFPLIDVQCSGCVFRAQIKTNHTRPSDEIFGATWDIMEKNLRVGYLVPPLIVNFKWNQDGKSRQEIHFYPFIDPKKNLKKRHTKIKKSGRELWMFNYVGLRDLPKLTLFKR